MEVGAYQSLEANGLCPWCGTEQETELHVLRDCNTVKEVWSMLIEPRDRCRGYRGRKE